ncbi:MAG: baseplate J/gp47 family protein [Saprospiraceae bacterium]|nr:baseplate J/gp47 family protein [Saprospiraceae bacterium]
MKNNPLTYISSDKPSGIETTLELRVNDILWKEVAYFYGNGPHDKIYIVRHNEDGQTSIVFGDGKNGSRLPTGQQNVKVKYRVGLGEKGLLQPKQLSTLLQKPLGIKEVVNPIATQGSQDSERIEQARSNANLTMFTLDRVVSLQDFEDFSRAFSGIQKAKAVWLWNGRKKLVHITVAGVDGSEIKTDGPIYKNLSNALKSNAAMGIDFFIESYTPKIATIKVKVFVNEDYVKSKVVDSIRCSLNLKYGFENRQFGEHLYLSDVSAFISSIEGVKAVDIDYLDFGGKNRNSVLIAQSASPGSDKPLPAELIVLNVGVEDIIAI